MDRIYRWGRRALLASCITVGIVACGEEDPVSPAVQGERGTPADGVERSIDGLVPAQFDNEISTTVAPGPDGVLGTGDDITFGSEWTGPTFDGQPSPPGDLWEALGVLFAPIDGGVRFTNEVGGCFGSHLDGATTNFDGGFRITFVENGIPVQVDAVSVEVVNQPVTLQAFDAQGGLLATRNLGTFRDFLTVENVGPIDRVDVTGGFWCIFTRVRWSVAEGQAGTSCPVLAEALRTEISGSTLPAVVQFFLNSLVTRIESGSAQPGLSEVVIGILASLEAIDAETEAELLQLLEICSTGGEET